MCVNLLLIQKATSKYVFGESKVTRGFWTARGREPLIPVLFNDQLYTHTLT